MSEIKTFGQFLLEQRKCFKMGIEAMANFLKVNSKTLKSWEDDEFLPPPEKLPVIFRVYKVGPDKEAWLTDLYHKTAKLMGKRKEVSEDDRKIAFFLGEVRKAKGLSPEKIAKACGLPTAIIRRIERGVDIERGNLEKIAAVHGLIIKNLPLSKFQVIDGGNKLGDFLVKSRRKIDKTINDVAEEMSLPSNTIYSWERGFNIPAEDRLPGLMKAYEVKQPVLCAVWANTKKPMTAQVVEGFDLQAAIEDAQLPGLITSNEVSQETAVVVEEKQVVQIEDTDDCIFTKTYNFIAAAELFEKRFDLPRLIDMLEFQHPGLIAEDERVFKMLSTYLSLKYCPEEEVFRALFNLM